MKNKRCRCPLRFNLYNSTMKTMINSYIYTHKAPNYLSLLSMFFKNVDPTYNSQGIWDKRVHHSNVYTFKDYNENKKSLPIHRPYRSHLVQDLALKLKHKKYPHSIFLILKLQEERCYFFSKMFPLTFSTTLLMKTGKTRKNKFF